ncbi:MAG: RrF2 family transcriptional regulator [Pelagibacteraceae bacterium]|jgi:Rrf2 family iron-sulfur cluster assembly transcriptional regulator|nr:[Fe-S]-binding protein [Candidatus Pelagibacter sp.]MAH54432.1 [Fe-S]-binding protein [Candidatus Pelagibacter sp.]MDP6680915.1 RrF2 family transcriptional regulator [Pelagibacteraceae bacterium]MDP6709747.1 RrF2 family transcriptional regulator [Pelagibacteraceae bacterium]|tara:strand:- start:74 stop:511 length:438 start_codon:yes stop_codon:yes gene_type:complete
MKLTNKGRYAVMAMADLARNNVGEPISLAEISLRQGIPISFLEQIFSKLKSNKLVTSFRGATGGYFLSRSADEITLSNIIKAVDERVKTAGCIKDSQKGCHGKTSKCMTHDLWNDLEIYINNFFEKNTLKDILFRASKSKQKQLN